MEAFLRQDFEDINRSLAAVEGDIQNVVKQRLDEIEKILAIAPLASVFLIGSTLEGILFDVARKNQPRFMKATAAPRVKGAIKQLDDWTLDNLIVVAHEIGIISPNVSEFSHSLRKFRNYIHPREQARRAFNPDVTTARLSLQVLKAAITEIAAHL
jgi:hypothetical protein